MAKKKTPNDLYWEGIKKENIRKYYEAFLIERGVDCSPHAAYCFVLENKNSYVNLDMDERKLIIYLAGELPEMYD